jgi:hypothetical protein
MLFNEAVSGRLGERLDSGFPRLNMVLGPQYTSVMEPLNEYDPTSSKSTKRPTIPGWKSYGTMLLLLTVGIFIGLGQHFYYRYLNGKQVSSVGLSQAWIINISTGFAFLFKTCLVAAVGTAFSQAFWYTVRRKAIRLDGIDAMHDARGNVLSFFNPDLLLKAKTVTILALICWFLPLTAVLSTGSLTGIQSKYRINHSCRPSFYDYK